MAIIQQDEEDQKQGQQGPVQIAGTAGAGASSGAPTAPGANPVSQNVAPSQNQGFADVGSYLDANKAGSQQLGNQVASNLTGEFNNTKGAIDNSASLLSNQVNQGYTPQDTALVNSALSAPESFVQNPNNVSKFQSQLNDTYSGPTNWADLGNLQGTVNQAQQLGSLYKTPGGNNVLAQRAEGSHTSQGINQLDALLLGSDPNAVQTVKAASDPFNTLTNYLNTQNTNLTSQIGNAQSNAQQAAQAAQTGLNTKANAFGTSLTNEAQQAEAARQAFNQNSSKAYNDLTPMEQWLQAYQGNSGMKVNDPFAPILGSGQPVVNPINVQNFATSGNYNTAAALQQLAGGSLNLPINSSTASQAGTAPSVGKTQPYDINSLADSVAKEAVTKELMKAHPNLSQDFLTRSGSLSALNQNSPIETLLNELQKFSPNITPWKGPNGQKGPEDDLAYKF